MTEIFHGNSFDEVLDFFENLIRENYVNGNLGFQSCWYGSFSTTKDYTDNLQTEAITVGKNARQKLSRICSDKAERKKYNTKIFIVFRNPNIVRITLHSGFFDHLLYGDVPAFACASNVEYLINIKGNTVSENILSHIITR